MSHIEELAFRLDAEILGKVEKTTHITKRRLLPRMDVFLLDRKGKEVHIGDYVYIQDNINRIFRIEGIMQSSDCFLLWNHTRYYPNEVTKVDVKL